MDTVGSQGPSLADRMKLLLGANGTPGGLIGGFGQPLSENGSPLMANGSAFKNAGPATPRSLPLTGSLQQHQYGSPLGNPPTERSFHFLQQQSSNKVQTGFFKVCLVI